MQGGALSSSLLAKESEYHIYKRVSTDFRSNPFISYIGVTHPYLDKNGADDDNAFPVPNTLNKRFYL